MRESSREAHESIKPLKESHYLIIKDAMIKIDKPCSGRLISDNCSLDYHAVMRRTSEMERLNIIEVFGRDEKTKRKPILWGLKQN